MRSPVLRLMTHVEDLLANYLSLLTTVISRSGHKLIPTRKYSYESARKSVGLLHVKAETAEAVLQIIH